jgi:hypothetical protein
VIRRSRSFLALVAVVVGCGAVVGAASPETSARLPNLYVLYTGSCTFSISDDAGAPVTAIPPGNYEVDVRSPIAFGTVPLSLSGPGDMTDCRGMAQFQLTGPGVSLASTITGGCMADSVLTATFQPNSTYVAQDNNQPGATRTTFTTLGAGTPVAPPPLSSSSSGLSSSTDIVGSGLPVASPTAPPVLGTLAGLVSRSGVSTLTLMGRPVSSLKAGRYRVAVTDNDPAAGLTVRQANGKAMLAPAVPFTGKRVSTIQLKAGRWMYYASAGKAHYFNVTA